MTDSGGLPGSMIEDIKLSDGIPDALSPGLVTFQSSLHPLLSSGTQYWVVLDAPDLSTFVGWFVDSSYSVGQWAESDADQPFYTVDDVLPAVQVLGTTAVPEPSSLLISTTGALGLLSLHFKRRRTSAWTSVVDRPEGP